MSFTIRHATTPTDIDGLSEVAWTGFGPNDGLVRLFFPQEVRDAHPGWVEDYKKWYTIQANDDLHTPGKHWVIAVDDDHPGKVVGLAQWDQPLGVVETPQEKQNKAVERMSRWPSTLNKEAWLGLIGDFARFMTGMVGEKKLEAMWFLNIMVVDPNYRRLGIGTKLLSWGVDRAAVEGRAAYLAASPMGEHLYRARGFELLGTMEGDIPIYIKQASGLI